MMCGMVAAAMLVAMHAASAQIVTGGLILNLEAGNNPLHPDSWLDLSSQSGNTYPGSLFATRSIAYTSIATEGSWA